MDQNRALLEGYDSVEIHLADRDAAYPFMSRAPLRRRYQGLEGTGKGLLTRFLGKVTGLSPA